MELIKHKEILELLQPYTIKDLKEGCIVELKKEQLVQICRVKETSLIDEYFFLYPDGTYSSSLLSSSEYENLKIYGHYDISTIFNYIKDNNIFTMLSINISDDNSLIYIEEGEDSEEEIYYEPEEILFPNKPLYLYTKTELDNLYNELTKHRRV